MSKRIVAAAVFLLLSFTIARPSGGAQKPITLAIRAADFEFEGDWSLRSDLKQNALIYSPDAGGTLPAVTGIDIPQPGQYRLWVCARDFPEDRPGTRTFHVSVAGQPSPHVFGTSGRAGYTWEDGGAFELGRGVALVSIEQPKAFARFQGIVLTTNANFTPRVPLTDRSTGLVKPVSLDDRASAGKTSPIRFTSNEPMARLANDDVRIEFLPAMRGATQTIGVRTLVHSTGGWIDAGADPDAEGYFAVCASDRAKLKFAGFYPRWTRGERPDPITVEAGGVSVRTIPGRVSNAMWRAGPREQMVPQRAVQVAPDRVKIEFEPSPVGTMEAEWSLQPSERSASIALTFTPAASGQVSLGYQLFFSREIDRVAEVLLPFMWQRHRLPPRPTTLLDNCTPTPISLAQPAVPDGQAARCFAIVADPAGIPFGWPDGRQTHFGLSITDDAGHVHPSIWGPVIGTPAAAAEAGKPVRFAFRVLVQAGDWYAGYRTAADQVDHLRDYRENVRTSLSDAALNMIDLIMDDVHSGWWDRAKAFYQIESKNGSSHASPMMLLSLYRLTGDEELYRKRALPTLEFMLSRDGPHFSPVPDDTGPYPAGSMNGPSKLFGTSTYAGLWELTGRRTDAFAQIAMPKDGVRPTAGYSHAQAFDEWLSRYLLTHDKRELDKACELADAYIRTQIQTPPARELGPQPFFYISFVPDWEGLLRLYEVTGRQAYLDAATFGARQLMTGVWTQPVIPSGTVTIHPANQFQGDAKHLWWKGPIQYRLGWPPAAGTIVEKSVPAWEVANVGLGFEQPVTFNPSGPARQIFEEAWAPHFLRLYSYTHDPAFLTYARNAIVGRWGNYPGYYILGHTDLMQGPQYPLKGPDVSDIYYHHIPAHLAWTIDYLVSEAEVLSDGRITFPALRQHGYAYFDSRIFGHAPGKVFEDEGAWLIFRRGLVTVDNVQLNTLTAHGPAGFHVILTNQSQAEQRAIVSFSPELLHFDPAQFRQGTVRIGTADPTPIALENGKATVIIPARGIATMTLPGVKLDVPAQLPADVKAPIGAGAIVDVLDPVAPAHAAAIQVVPGRWDAYVWSSASRKQARSATLHYSIGQQQGKLEAKAYPFEFSLPIADEKTNVRFHLEWIRPDGSTASGTPFTLENPQ